MGLLTRLFGGADGIRESMRVTYLKHFREAQERPLREGDTPHTFALYQALGSRYMLTGKWRNEFVLHSELMPFLWFPEEEAVELIAEYAVFQEEPADARLSHLQSALRKAVKALMVGDAPRIAALLGPANADTVTLRGVVTMAAVNGVAWLQLLDHATRSEIATDAQALASKMQ